MQMRVGIVSTRRFGPALRGETRSRPALLDRARPGEPATRRCVGRVSSSLSDMSEESLQRALQFQQQQAKEKSKRTSVGSPSLPKTRVSYGSPQSKQVQDDLATRLGQLPEEQTQAAIQRQVGATPAQWTEPEESQTAPEPQPQPPSPVEKDASTEQSPPSAADSASPPPPPVQSKKAPAKRFKDGSVLYTADQFD